MKTVTVYAFRYFDRDAKAMRLAADMATAWAIRDICAELLPESARQVHCTPSLRSPVAGRHPRAAHTLHHPF